MPEAMNGADLREQMILLGKFLRHPRTVGALSVSSRTVARVMASNVSPNGSLSVVELGSGTGALTGAILNRLKPSDRFLAIEIVPEFVEEFRQRLPAAECICASAADLYTLAVDRDMAPVDHIISGLPFATLPVETTRKVLAAVGRTLKPGGTFTTFQYVHAYSLHTTTAFRREMSMRLGAQPHRKLVLRNAPPAFILTWRRSDGAGEAVPDRR
jgi:phospholipid N-methyltransferase